MTRHVSEGVARIKLGLQDELRIGILEFSDTAGRVVPRWFHIDAFFEYADIDGSLTDPSNIEGAQSP